MDCTLVLLLHFMRMTQMVYLNTEVIIYGFNYFILNEKKVNTIEINNLVYKTMHQTSLVKNS